MNNGGGTMINIGDTVKIIANNGVSDYDECIGMTAKVIGKPWHSGCRWYELEGYYVHWESKELRKVEEQQ